MRSFIAFILVALFALGSLTLMGCVRKPPEEAASPEAAPATPEEEVVPPATPEPAPATGEEAAAEETPPGEGE